MVAGLDGTLPDLLGPFKGWSWDASFNFGRTDATFILDGSLQSSRIAAALGPSMLIGGKPTCVGTAGDASTAIAGCVPLDLFHGSPSITKDQVDYLVFTGTSKGFNQLQVLPAQRGRRPLQAHVRPAGGPRPRRTSTATSPAPFINDPLTAKFDSSNGGAADTNGALLGERVLRRALGAAS